jgi:hypothetical protein
MTIIALAFYWPTLFVLGHIPIPQVVYQAEVSDKSLHFLAYLILVFLLWFAISPDKKVDWRKAGPWWILLVVVLYGIADEISQGYVGRNCDILDFFTNLIGSLTGLVLFTIFTFWPAALSVAGIVIFGITNIARANVADMLPITNAMFHLFAYAALTVLWIQCLHAFKPIKISRASGLLPAVVGPVTFLLIVKLSSAILGRTCTTSDIIVSIGAIAVTIGVYYLITFYQKNSSTEF